MAIALKRVEKTFDTLPDKRKRVPISSKCERRRTCVRQSAFRRKTEKDNEQVKIPLKVTSRLKRLVITISIIYLVPFIVQAGGCRDGRD